MSHHDHDGAPCAVGAYYAMVGIADQWLAPELMKMRIGKRLVTVACADVQRLWPVDIPYATKQAAIATLTAMIATENISKVKEHLQEALKILNRDQRVALLASSLAAASGNGSAEDRMHAIDVCVQLLKGP